MIWILIKAAVSAVVLHFTFCVGRCSAIHEYCDFMHGRLSELSDDIASYLKDYDK